MTPFWTKVVPSVILSSIRVTTPDAVEGETTTEKVTACPSLTTVVAVVSVVGIEGTGVGTKAVVAEHPV